MLLQEDGIETQEDTEKYIQKYIFYLKRNALSIALLGLFHLKLQGLYDGLKLKQAYLNQFVVTK